jgi:hypothetical protein
MKKFDAGALLAAAAVAVVIINERRKEERDLRQSEAKETTQDT